MTTITIAQVQVPQISKVTITGTHVGEIDIRNVNSANISTVTLYQNIAHVPTYYQSSFLGSDLSAGDGGDGTANRILTLPNTRLSFGVSVFMDTGFMHPGLGITINNLSAGSTITFLTEVWDTQSIWVSWYE